MNKPNDSGKKPVALTTPKKAGPVKVQPLAVDKKAAPTKPSPTAQKPTAVTAGLITMKTGPRPFVFKDANDQPVGEACISNAVTMKDLAGATLIYIVGPGAYRINKGPWLKDAAKVKEGDIVQVRLAAAPEAAKARRARICIGPYYTDFKVTTAK